MRLLKKSKMALLSYASVLILHVSFSSVATAEEIDDIQESTYSLLSSTSLSFLIYPLKNQPESIDPMHDDADLDEKEVIKNNIQKNSLFEYAVKFNDYFQRVTAKFNNSKRIKPLDNDVSEDTGVIDTKEVNCSSKKSQ